MKLTGQSALVTGSSSGIGAAIAIRLAEEGADVIINYRGDEAGARRTLQQVEATGRTGVILQADVSKKTDTETLIAGAFKRFEGLSILVNNAGIEKRSPFLEATGAASDRALLDAKPLKGVFSHHAGANRSSRPGAQRLAASSSRPC